MSPILCEIFWELTRPKCSLKLSVRMPFRAQDTLRACHRSVTAFLRNRKTSAVSFQPALISGGSPQLVSVSALPRMSSRRRIPLGNPQILTLIRELGSQNQSWTRAQLHPLAFVFVVGCRQWTGSQDARFASSYHGHGFLTRIGSWIRRLCLCFSWFQGRIARCRCTRRASR